jgi:hypothetical protein
VFLSAKNVILENWEGLILTNKVNINIWGRSFELEVKYDCYAGEEVLSKQVEAIDSFVKNEKNIAESLCEVKKYCKKNNSEEIGTNLIDNIFKYVIPDYLYVVRDMTKYVVAVMCNYKYNIENGIAVVFENDHYTMIGKQDIIL